MEHQEILVDSWSKAKARNNLILHFNFQLDKQSNYFTLNESILENLVARLDNLVYVKDVSYWLTLARINELALLCAENYANNGELTLVGDLMLNPRLILIHIRGENRPVVKKRHTPLTEQFKFAGETIQDIVEWLKTETCLETKTEALLPWLHRKLEKSGYFRKEYLDLLNHRRTKMAELTGFLSGIGSIDCFSLYQWVEKASPADREFLKSKLCRCNLDFFIALGYRIRNMARCLSTPMIFPNPAIVNQNGGAIYVESKPDNQRPVPAIGLG